MNGLSMGSIESKFIAATLEQGKNASSEDMAEHYGRLCIACVMGNLALQDIAPVYARIAYRFAEKATPNFALRGFEMFSVLLQHHYGWVRYDVEARMLAEAAYIAVRRSHTFLTDTNHTYTAGERTMPIGGRTMTWTSDMIRRYVAACQKAPRG